MTQGTRISGNLCHDNVVGDINVEVNHGPYLVDNNIFLSKIALQECSQGGAFAHNLIAGDIVRYVQRDLVPYHEKHSTEIAGLFTISGGDTRFHNNIIVRGEGLQIYDDAELPMQVDGNVYLNGAVPYQGEINFVELPEFNPNIEVVEEEGTVYLHFTLPQANADQQNQLVTTELLGRARITGAPYETPDGRLLKIDTDYFDKGRNKQNPSAGPFENPGTGKLSLKVWQGKRQDQETQNNSMQATPKPG